MKYDYTKRIPYYHTALPQIFLNHYTLYPCPVIWVPMVPVCLVPYNQYYSFPQFNHYKMNREYRLEKSASPAGTIAITAIGKFEDDWQNPLDSGDARIFKEFLSTKGWKTALEHYDEAVTAENFVTAGATCDIMFHTGHGSDNGSFPLYPKGQILSWRDIGVLSKAKFLFMMTCSVLTAKDWGRLLSNGAHHIFGYVEPSWDYTDNTIVEEFLARCYGEGGIAPSKILDAWEYVNTTYNEPWAVVSHRGNMNDYMFGVESGLTRDIHGLDDIVRITSSGIEELFYYAIEEAPPSLYDVKVKHEKLDFENIAQELLKGGPILTRNDFFGANIYTDKQSNMYVYPTGAMIYEGIRDRNEFKGTQEDAIRIASEFIQTKGGGIPTFSYVAEVNPQYESDSSQEQKAVLSYTVIFKNSVAGVTVDGNYGDSIKVIVDNSGVSYLFRMWREVTSVKPIVGATLVDQQNAVTKAENYFNSVMKTISPPRFEGSSLVYWSESFKKFQHELPIAWKVTLSGRNIFVDAQTGNILSRKR